jgi:ADP-heptose:LPS heptosyltransferase
MRILVMRPGSLGDVILTLPALQALAGRFPGVQIEVLGKVSVLEWLPSRSVVTSVSSFDRVDLGALFLSDAEPPASLQDYLDAFDVLVSYVTGPEQVFARNLSRLARGRVVSCDTRAVANLETHMSDYLQQPLRELGVAPSAQGPLLRLTAQDERKAAQWWTSQRLDGCRVLAIHPGSGSAGKNWALQRFVEVAHALSRRQHVRILWLTGAADEQTIPALQETLGMHDALWLREPSLPLLAAVLVRCQCYLGNDSGVSHLAAPLGTPSTAIFGPTDPVVWAPRGRSVQVLRGSAPCAPCSPEQRSDCRERTCLEWVSVESVLEACDRLCSPPQFAV